MTRKQIILGESESTLGQLVRVRRQKLKMSLAQLGEKVGFTRQHIHAIEFGKSDLTVNKELLDRFAAILQIDEKELKDAQRLAVMEKRKKRKTQLGEFLTVQRLGQQLKQGELAERVEISAAALSNIERGVLLPSRQLLERLEAALRCKIPSELIPKGRSPGRPRKKR